MWLTWLVVRLAVGLACAFAGFCAGFIATFPIAAVVGKGDTAARAWVVLVVVGTAVGFVASFRIPDERLGLARAGVGEGAPSPVVARAARVAFVATGAWFQYRFTLDDTWGDLVWVPAAGLAVVVVALAAASTPGSRVAVRALVPVLWVPGILLLGAFGLGIGLAPAALGVGAAALVPDRVPRPDASRLLRGLLWTAILVILALALLFLGGPTAA